MFSTCFEPEGSTYKTAYTDASTTHYTIPVYSRLPEDEHSDSKHVEDFKKLKIKILI